LLIAKPRLKALDPVDLRACDVGRAERIDDDGDALARELVVRRPGGPRSNPSAYWKPEQTAALDGDAQDLGLARGLVGHQVP
jgi:hypothetical protein